ncbi:MAG: bifunctional riboflavin kinase/FAD synthetase [Bacteroidota bacterium]
MKLYQSLDAYQPGSHTVATIGTFDGLHIGHRTILQRIQEVAKEIDGESLLISFYPHPRLVLFPDNNPLKLLHTLEEKIAMLNDIGLDKLLLLPFTKEFSRMPSRAFIQHILSEKIGIHKIIIGYDHRFGKNRAGGIEELQQYAPELGYLVEEIPAQSIDDAKVSSTKIRRAIQDGKVELAKDYLGYPYSFAGKVIHGEKQGRQLGYPTANIQPDDPLKLIPADGVYFVRVWVESEELYGMMSIGTKPTIGEFDRYHEVYIFDFARDIYDQTIRVDLLNWIRPQEKFDSLDTLIAAIQGDEQFCRKKMAQLGRKS